jgi:CMP-N,N'-diacetyllegionaminic acid synthase
MIKGKKILAVIPPRGGSKCVPRKNVNNLHAKQLTACDIEEALKSGYIDMSIWYSVQKTGI